MRSSRQTGATSPARVRPSARILRVPPRASLEPRDLYQPATFPVTSPRRYPDHVLPVGASEKALEMPRVNLFIADDVGLARRSKPASFSAR